MSSGDLDDPGKEHRDPWEPCTTACLELSRDFMSLFTPQYWQHCMLTSTLSEPQ